MVNVVIWVPWIFSQHSEVHSIQISTLTLELAPWINAGACMILISAASISFNLLVDRLEFELPITHLPAYTLSVVLSAMLYGKGLSIELLALFPFMIALYKILSVYRESRAFPQYFEAGFWLGISTLLYHPFAMLLPVFIMIIAYTRTFNWRETFLPIVGAITPLALWIQIYYLINSEWWWARFSVDAWTVQLPELLTEWIFTGVWVIMILAGLRLYWSTYGKSTNKSKNTKNGFLIASMGLAAAALVSNPPAAPVYAVLLAPAICLFSSFLFQFSSRAWISQLLFLVFHLPLVLSLVEHFKL